MEARFTSRTVRLRSPWAGGSARPRGPVAVWLLSVVTLGIYVLVWWYKINREVREFAPVNVIYCQAVLNQVWAQARGGL